jgi:RNA polymerase sporulation-specific sigma factor
VSAPFAADLLEAAKAGDAKAAETLVEENSGLIWSIARRYFGRGVDADDLFQLGCVGLVKAIRGYDGAYGTRFSTYAVPKISGEIRRFLRDDGAVKVSRGVKERAAVIRNARSELSSELGREPVLSELSERTGISAEDIAVAETATSTADSLQRSAGEDGLTLENVLGDWSAEERLLERVSLREALERLGAKERQVVALRFYRGMTQAEAAKVLSVSQVQVSRIERRAIDALRESLKENE